MKLELDDRQRTLRTAFRDFFARHGSSHVTPLDDAASGSRDRSRWRAFARRGWLAVTVDQSAGGLGLGEVEAGLLAEEMGRALVGNAYLGAGFAIDLLRLAIPTEATNDVIADAACGALRITLAGEREWRMAEPVTVTLDHARRTLDGQCLFVPAALRVDALLVLAADEGMPHLLLVPAVDQTFDAELQPDLADSDFHRIRFRDLELAHTGVLTPGGITANAYRRALSHARLRLAAYLVGLGDGALELGVERARTRRQFGTPIAHFQSISFGLAALAAELDAMRFSIREAAWRADRGEEVTRVAARVLASTAELTQKLAARVVHVHGTYGLTAASAAQLYYRRAAVDGLLLGSPHELRDEALTTETSNGSASSVSIFASIGERGRTRG